MRLCSFGCFCDCLGAFVAGRECLGPTEAIDVRLWLRRDPFQSVFRFCSVSGWSVCYIFYHASLRAAYICDAFRYVRTLRVLRLLPKT